MGQFNLVPVAPPPFHPLLWHIPKEPIPHSLLINTSLEFPDNPHLFQHNSSFFVHQNAIGAFFFVVFWTRFSGHHMRGNVGQPLGGWRGADARQLYPLECVYSSKEDNPRTLPPSKNPPHIHGDGKQMRPPSQSRTSKRKKISKRAKNTDAHTQSFCFLNRK